MLNYLKALSRLPQTLTRFDKISLSVLTLIIGLTAFFWWHSVTDGWLVKPVKGGTYTEGLITETPFELDQISDKLTKIGLTYTDNKNRIQPALAERWEISEDGKTYTFHLRPKVPAGEIAAVYRDLPNWQNITIEAPDGQTIVIKLKQPFAPLLAFTSEPVIELGPYIAEKQNKSTLSFVANTNFVLGEPNIQRILLSTYGDDRTIKAALQRQEIMGSNRQIKSVSGTVTKTVKLTKRTVILFNLDKPVFKDNKALRERIRDNKKLDQPLTVTLATSQDPELLVKANEFRDKAAKIGLTVSINSVNAVTLERDIIPNDNYDLLITDLNYGYDGDPYPFWHSSQLIAPGQNYASYNSKAADKLIEEARQTLNEDERNKKHQEIQSIIEQDVPAIFYPYQEYKYTVTNRLKGVKEGIGAVPADRFTEVWNWYLKAKKQRQ